MKCLRLAALLLFCLYLTGCAKPTPEISISQKFYNQTNKTVGIAMVEQEEAKFFAFGNIGLLDYAIIAGATAPLSNHLKTLDLSEFSAVKNQLARELENKGFNVVMIEDFPKLEDMDSFSDPNGDDDIFFHKKNLMPLQKKYGVDYLLLLQTYLVGADRTYNGFLPLRAPRATFGAKTHLVDLTDNHLLINKTAFLFRDAEGNWDEPPNFPGLTNSFYITLEQVREQVMNQLTVQQAAVAPAADPATKTKK